MTTKLCPNCWAHNVATNSKCGLCGHLFPTCSTGEAKADSVQRVVSCEQVLAAIDAEPELPGEMPNEVWSFMTANKEKAAEMMRANIRAMKHNIKERLGLLAANR